jgi:hypothetical protein
MPVRKRKFRFKGYSLIELAALFFGYFLLGKQKKVTQGHRGARKQLKK